MQAGRPGQIPRCLICFQPLRMTWPSGETKKGLRLPCCKQIVHLACENNWIREKRDEYGEYEAPLQPPINCSGCGRPNVTLKRPIPAYPTSIEPEVTVYRGDVVYLTSTSNCDSCDDYQVTQNAIEADNALLQGAVAKQAQIIERLRIKVAEQTRVLDRQREQHLTVHNQLGRARQNVRQLNQEKTLLEALLSRQHQQAAEQQEQSIVDRVRLEQREDALCESLEAFIDSVHERRSKASRPEESSRRNP